MDPKGFQRKLTAILSADMAGYSRLMQDDEAATVKSDKFAKKEPGCGTWYTCEMPGSANQHS